MSDVFVPRLLAWWSRHGRELPWRATRDPYLIWLSEVILQQTRVQQGLPYWQRFVAAFPTVEALAAADEDAVLKLWQGLGYYSRARNLQAAARQVVALGRFPDTVAGLRALKGVGPYTAAAIASFAYGVPVAAVDGNAYRVLARHFGIDTPIDTPTGKREFDTLARSLVPKRRPGDFNQAMMDLGATCCTPRNPHCGECPLQDTCRALDGHRIDDLPVKSKRTAVTERRFSYVFVVCDGYWAMHKRAGGDIWQGLWEPVMIEGSATVRVDGQEPMPVAEGLVHVLTHRRLVADIYLLQTATRPALPEGYVWTKWGDVDRHPIPRLVERALELVAPLVDI